jgi:hypothetical protein
MSAGIAYELLFEKQAFLNVLLDVNLLFLKEVESLAYSRLLKMLSGFLRIGRRFYGVKKPGLMEIAIQNPM